ncbi:hypothetical protein PPERSA_00541 [Pseudocohnilembus persalinus]|uniref:Uncharacterized protein n=1 Tax=Pseudocohnilembus persalinus TaxID=266149 RepID=A0A0V0QHZ9_PSEPJ|nr:hypothetical protein PPERSA_00541 [Pseudocohnilembus persalinus]|eukprot:KRX01831.1 hypothetical protein PPERSA_00541 [Pseudocohnilembus persalinus]
MQLKNCQKSNHNLDYQYINWTDKKERFLQCNKCSIECEEPNYTKILISDILNENYKVSQVQNWPPIKDKELFSFMNSVFKCSEENPNENNLLNQIIQQQIQDYFKDQQVKILERLNQIEKNVKVKFETYIQKFYNQNETEGKMNIEQIIKNFQIDEFRTKIKEFLDNKIDIDKIFEFKEQQNEILVNAQEQIKQQFKKQQEIQELFNQLKQELDDSLLKYNQHEFPIKEQINLNLFKSNYKNIPNSFTITPDNKQITFDNQNTDYYKQVYCDILEKQKTYHIKIRIDAKGTIKNQYIFFGIDTQQKKDKQLNNTNYLYAFHQNSNTSGSKNFKKEGQYNRFNEFFRDNQTILNIVFNINKKQFEMFDDQNQLKCSIELQDVDEPIFYIMNHQLSQAIQNELYIDSVITY